MYDRELVLDALQHVEISIDEILQWTSSVNDVDDFVTSTNGMILLNAICMKLMAIGEEIKSVDKRSQKMLFPSYPSIDWREVMKMRDVIAHHYFEIDAEVVFKSIKGDMPPLLAIIRQIKTDILADLQ